jgi:DNA-binding CsgD family transcriptional regulator
MASSRQQTIPESALHEIFEQSTDAVFGIDTTGTVRFANSSFETLLGYGARQIRGSGCATVLCGTDMHGQPFCGKDCPIPKTVVDRPSINDFDLVVKRADGSSVLVNIGACYTPKRLRDEAGQVDVFFSLRQVTPQRLLRRMATAPGNGSAKGGIRERTTLTSREAEILGLAANGMKTAQIADRLCVSTQTVRTHFKNIYQKIGAHSRAEAVVFAFHQGLN